MACVVALLVAPRAALAQRVQVQANVETDRVEVGETLAYTLQVMVTGGPMPTEPKPGSTTGFSVVGTSSAPMQMHMSMNGRPSEMNSLTTSWTLRADKVGTFTLGPASAVVDGAPQRAAPVRITVVPRGQGPARTRRDPFGGSPNDPFGGLGSLRGLLGMDDEPPPQLLRPTADPKLNMDQPRAPVAFLRATIDKTRAVVGEQVTLNVYLYADPNARQGRPSDVHEATANDFVKRSLLEDETRATDLGTAMVGGRLWSVNLIRKNALFPLKTGRLTIEPMSLTLPQARVGLRESETLQVDVGEPPAAGRPAGFTSGDVGDFSLQATVSQRAVEQDGAVGVNIELRGTGNLPAQLTLPVIPGVEWLEPTVRERVGAMQNDRFGGTRTFSHVVRIHKAGAVDLGEVRLPFYDPEKRTYGVARATIGIVDVKPGTTQDAGAETAELALANMPAPRAALEGVRPENAVTDRAWYWFALFGTPFACIVGIVGRGVWERARRRRAEAAPDPRKVARARRADATDACNGTDGSAAMGAIARAVHASVQAELGVNLRGSVGSAAQRELEDAGLGEATARSILEVLRACEDARFSPEGVAMSQARETWDRAQKAIDAVEDEA
jgi:hypothetical protein